MDTLTIPRAGRWICAAIMTVMAAVWADGSLHGQDRPRSETLLPSTTKAWVSIPDAIALVDQFNAIGLGQLFMSPPMQEAIESLREQVAGFIQEQNIQLGITWEDVHNVRSGEVCIAGVVLPVGPSGVEPLARSPHGIVMLVDIAGNELATELLLEKIHGEMARHGATPEPMGPIQGAQVSKWRWPGRNGGPQRATMIVAVEGWLIATDNEMVLREVLLRIQGRVTDRLADVAAFQNVLSHVELPGVTPHARWFIEPFGYIELAQAIYDENRPFVVARNNYAKILREQGFDVLNGLGGMFALNQSDRDIVHRTFISLVPVADRQGGQRKVSNLFDFENRWGHQLSPEKFAIPDASNYFTFTWNAGNLLENADNVIDAFAYEGYYQKMIHGMREDGIDVVAAAKMLDNRFTLISKVRQPIRENSECVAIVVKVQQNPDEFFAFVRKFVNEGRLIQDGEIEYLFIDRTEVADDGDIFDPVRGGGVRDFDQLENEGASEPFNLFGKVYISVSDGHLIIANQLDYLVELIRYDSNNLAVETDYRQVTLSLDQLGIQADRVATRGFGRWDRMVESNYHLFRQGRLPASDTMLARILNHAMATPDQVGTVRTQKLDGSLLPEDFQQVVAPFLGASGWTMEQLSDGWLISGVLLKKNSVSEVADGHAGESPTLKK